MRSPWKVVAALIACLAVLVGIGFGWRAYRVRTKLVEAGRLTRQRAEQGDAQAQIDLAHMYYYGRGVPKSYTEAAEWERKAADQGNAKGQYRLGYLYYYGWGLPQDRAAALEWDRRAADQGLADAQTSVGSFYYYGDGVPQDYVEAARWYRMAANQGEAEAQNALGLIYDLSKGVPQDYAEALRWYRKAANQGNARAEYNLGNLYYHGRGVPQDRAEAFRWFHKAAVQGDDYANRALSLNLTTARELFAGQDLLLGLWLALNFLSFNYLVPHKSLRDRRQRLITGTGVLWIVYAGMSWYGYTHHKIRQLNLSPNAFTCLWWSLHTVTTGLFIYIVWRWMKRSSDGSSESIEVNAADADSSA